MSDLLINLQNGAQNVLQILQAHNQNQSGGRIEDLLATIGSLAGFTCQMAIRADAQSINIPAAEALMEIETNDGTKYYFGQEVNHLLAVSDFSVLTLAAAGAEDQGCTDLPNVNEIGDIFEYTASVIGSDQFGIPRLPQDHMPTHPLAHYVRQFWPIIRPILNEYCGGPFEWPIVIGLAAKQVIITESQSIDPKIAFTFIAECAIPCAKYDPAALGITL